MLKSSAKLWVAGIVLGVVIAFLGVWAFYLEPSSLTVHRVTLQIPGWDNEQRGLKIAVLTDLHVGSPYWGIDKLKMLVTRTNAEHPDLVLLLGDYVIREVIGGKFVAPEPIAETLKGLRAPLGVAAVLGNHDWWFNGPRIRWDFQQAGIIMLENQAHRFEFRGKSLWIVGLADFMTRAPSIAAGLEQVHDNGPVIAIMHNPDSFPDIPARVNLSLAGHTHGGQVNFPWLGRLVVPSNYGQRYAYGHVVERGRHLFVSSGVGTSIIPVRFRVPPEILILTIEQIEK